MAATIADNNTIVKFLMCKGANTKLVNNQGDTALILAIKADNRQVVETLLNK